MNVRSLIRMAVRQALVEAVKRLDKQEHELVMRIDSMPYHYMPTSMVDPEDEDLLDSLESKGAVRRMPPKGRYPDRYVVTSLGSHASGMFDQSHLDLKAWRREKASRMSENVSRDEAWVESQRDRLESSWSRGDMIEWLSWADPNGSYSDEMLELEDMDPLTDEELLELVMSHVAENLETPEEMRVRSRR